MPREQGCDGLLIAKTIARSYRKSPSFQGDLLVQSSGEKSCRCTIAHLRIHNPCRDVLRRRLLPLNATQGLWIPDSRCAASGMTSLWVLPRPAVAGVLRQIAVRGLLADVVFLVVAMALGGIERHVGRTAGALVALVMLRNGRDVFGRRLCHRSSPLLNEEKPLIAFSENANAPYIFSPGPCAPCCCCCFCRASSLA